MDSQNRRQEVEEAKAAQASSKVSGVPATVLAMSMKPSFSDNFVAEKLSKAEHEPAGPTKAPLAGAVSNVSSNADETSKCFEDDFAHFQLPTSSISGRESTVSDQVTAYKEN
jgi:hypothetical protein